MLTFYRAAVELNVVDQVTCLIIFFYHFELLGKATSKISFSFEKKIM